MRWRYVFLLLIGLSQMAGDVFSVRALKGVGAATTMAPAPKVFSTVHGLETFSTRFEIEMTDKQGRARRFDLSRTLYSRLKGPYNRRNTFGALIAYGPVLTKTEQGRAIFRSVSQYAICGEAPLLRELGLVPDQFRPGVTIYYQLEAGWDRIAVPTVLEVKC